MRTRLERTYRFEAAHFLPKVPPGHKCARMHGHSYQVEVVIEGEVDAERGWVMDFAEIDEHALPLVRQLDHQVLNEIEGLANPTSELLAVWLWKRLAPTLPGLVEVVVSRDADVALRYRGAMNLRVVTLNFWGTEPPLDRRLALAVRQLARARARRRVHAGGPAARRRAGRTTADVIADALGMHAHYATACEWDDGA